MLSPEVWQFQPPKSGFRVRSNLPEKSIIDELSVNHFFHNIFVLCADTLHEIPARLEAIFEDSSYYKILNCRLSDIVQHDVIEGYLKKGRFSCLSVGTDSCISSVTPKGLLSIVLNSQFYHELGIEGKRISKGDREPAYHIDVNLTDENFKPGKKLYNRVQERLQGFKEFTLILRWEPDDERICPSSIAKYFAEKGLQIEVCTPKPRLMRQYIHSIPSPSAGNIEDLIEWMGMVAIGGDLNPEDKISTYVCEDDNSTAGHITAFNITGFFTSEHVLQLRLMLRDVINDKISRWAGVTAQCFSNTPSRKELTETKNYIPSDRLVAVILNQTDDEIFCESFKLN